MDNSDSRMIGYPFWCGFLDALLTNRSRLPRTLCWIAILTLFTLPHTRITTGRLYPLVDGTYARWTLP